MFRIGEFSKMSKTTIKTLRYYDEIGLLKPCDTDKFTSHRFYSTEQLFWLHRIQELRQIGLSINETNMILSGHDYESILLKRKAELVSELAEGQSQLSRLEFILQGENAMNYSATITELPGCIVYSKKMTVPNYDAFFEVVPEIGKTIEAKYPELKCTVPEYCFIVYLDGEHKEKDINIEFCEAVDKVYPDFEDFKFKEIEAVTAVSVMHKGAYSKLGEAYAYLFKWIEENGYTATDNPRESYIDGMWNKENEADWLTEIQVPIVRR